MKLLSVVFACFLLFACHQQHPAVPVKSDFSELLRDLIALQISVQDMNDDIRSLQSPEFFTRTEKLRISTELYAPKLSVTNRILLKQSVNEATTINRRWHGPGIATANWPFLRSNLLTSLQIARNSIQMESQ